MTNYQSELNNVLVILNQMQDELELMRMSKQCNGTPDGSSCDINGSWNSETCAGLHLELASGLSDDKLTVNLSDKPFVGGGGGSSTSFKIDSSWKCSGMQLHAIGGPFYFHCSKAPLETLAIFQGICKKCSGYDTIFGQWHLQHLPKDCRQLYTFIETKNDIFRRNTFLPKLFNGTQQREN